MKKNEPVSHIMTRDPVTVHHGDPISKIRRIFVETGIHHLPVTHGKELVGMISWTDLMRFSFGDAFGTSAAAVDATLDHTHTLEDLMQAHPVTLPVTASIREAAEILSEGKFHALPIVEGKNLAGIVSSADLIRFLRDLY